MSARLRTCFAAMGLSPWDVAAAAVFTLASLVWMRHNLHGAGPLGAPAPPPGLDGVVSRHPNGLMLNLLPTVALAARRRLPYSAFVVGFGGALLLFAVQDQAALAWPAFAALVILAWSVVADGRNLAVSMALLLVATVAGAFLVAGSTPSLPSWLGPFAVLGPVGLAAATIRTYQLRAHTAAERNALLEREQEANTRTAIAQERARVARDLHDVVSHHVSVMIIQAGAAGKVIESRPDLAAKALEAIEDSGRQAMAELRQLLGLVSPVDDRLHPLPGLGNLEQLISTVREAGQPVTFRPSAGTVPADLHLTVYRVVQEALTNALRYAPGAATEVELSQDEKALVVRVTNARPASSTPPATGGSGSGLVGLTERVRLRGGTLEAHPDIDGGYRVTARFRLKSGG